MDNFFGINILFSLGLSFDCPFGPCTPGVGNSETKSENWKSQKMPVATSLVLFGVEEFPSLGQILLLFVLIFVFLSGKAIWELCTSKLPPGPWGLPVVGKSFCCKSRFISSFVFTSLLYIC